MTRPEGGGGPGPAGASEITLARREFARYSLFRHKRLLNVLRSSPRGGCCPAESWP
jgi:hypothetical protein